MPQPFTHSVVFVGELTAHCMGPTKVAYCELVDHRDGRFTLHVKPQEAGRHVLQIKFGGEHVPGIVTDPGVKVHVLALGAWCRVKTSVPC